MNAALAVIPYLWACEAAPRVRVQPERRTAPRALVEPKLAFYRKYTEGMLRRYTRFSMEAGRVPSMLGQEMFRGRVTNYRVRSFEDVVIFVHDVEKCLRRLDGMQQLLITRIGIQQYTQEEAAEMMGLTRRTVVRRYNAALDQLTAVFLAVWLLEPRVECQEGGRHG